MKMSEENKKKMHEILKLCMEINERDKEIKRNNVPLIIIEIVLVIVLILIVINLLGIPARLNQIMK